MLRACCDGNQSAALSHKHSPVYESYYRVYCTHSASASSRPITNNAAANASNDFNFTCPINAAFNIPYNPPSAYLNSTRQLCTPLGPQLTYYQHQASTKMTAVSDVITDDDNSWLGSYSINGSDTMTTAAAADMLGLADSRFDCARLPTCQVTNY